MVHKKSSKVVVTAALPYANGEIHIGHLLEYIQADVYTRFLRLIGKDALYICASDMHGTPIEVNARKEKIDPEKFALKFWKSHQEDFTNYHINFSNFYKTHSDENKELAEHFFKTLKKKDLIYLKKVNIIFCENCNRSLPDRYVKGTCPNCSSLNQYGDICEKCGTVLKGVDLINPKCSLCNKTPIQKESLHYFFKLSKFSTKLKNWLESDDAQIQPEVKNWLTNWLKGGLEDWCISRDNPYFGFTIPESKEDTGQEKFFYVWLDAPIGYISSTKNYCQNSVKKCRWEDYWHDGIVYHFIGKDIAYFHYLFWPAMLMAMNIPIPKLTVHGFITVDGKKMSKSRGTFFTAKDFLKMYSAESLRFYYSSHLDRKVVDIDLNFKDFQSVINNVLAGNLGNFCYRVLTFAEKNYGSVEKVSVEKELVNKFQKLIEEVHSNYVTQDFKSVVKNILKISDLGNAYFQKSEVWKDKNSVLSKEKVGFCVNLARNLAILVSPILPLFSEKIFVALNEKNNVWHDLNFSWKGKLKKVNYLVQKIEQIPEIENFPLQLKVGKIIEIKDHPNADSLYLLKVDFSSFGKKQIVAGLKKYFPINDLLNKKAVFCVNMKPVKLRGEISEGMILAADDSKNVALLNAGETEVGADVNFLGMINSSKEVTFDEFMKLKLIVKNGNIFYDGKKLSSKIVDIKVSNIDNGTLVR